MAFSNSRSMNPLLLLLLLAATLQLCAAARKIPVGGNTGWGLGVDYNGWVRSAGPFRVGDTLVFGGPRGTRLSSAHNVYLMKDQAHYNRCDFGGAIRQGGSYTLSQKKVLYFGCSMAGHCQSGMKFAANPQ